MNINSLYTRQESTDDSVVVQKQWGYCREQNAVRLGYAVNILAAVVGLMLMLTDRGECGAAIGQIMCLCVGASFGAAYFKEQIAGVWAVRLSGAMVGSTACAYAALAWNILV